ncbi:MAG: bacterial Ig-like domain-containing protein [Eubacterium sp.]
MRKFKKLLCFLICSCLIFSLISPVYAQGSSNFTPRYTAPNASDSPGYSSQNPFQLNPNTGGNCTWYAWGRAYEILGHPLPSEPMYRDDHTNNYNSFHGDAYVFWYDNKELYDSGRGGFPYGNEPKVGSIAVWSYLASNCGHVAIVEDVSGDTVTTSNSSWSWMPFYMDKLSAVQLKFTPTFLGYIYLLDETEPLTYHSTVDSPTANETITDGNLYLQGWGIDGDGVDHFSYAIDGGQEQTMVAIARPDVANAYPGYPTGKEGFSQNIDISNLSNGEHSVQMKAHLSNGNVESVGTRSFTLDMPRTVKVADVTMNKTVLNLLEGKTDLLEATVLPENATNKEVTWTSSVPEVASVDVDGTVTALTKGTTIITVTTADGQHTATSTVNVTQLAEEKPIVNEPVSMSVNTTGMKTHYKINKDQTLDLTGGILDVKYTDGTVKSFELTKDMCEVVDLKTVGNKTVKVNYKGLSTTFGIIVDDKVLTNIAIVAEPEVTTYTANKPDQEIVVDGGKVALTHDDNMVVEIPLTKEMCVPESYDLNKVGEQKVEVKIEDKVTSFGIKVESKKVSTLEVKSKPDKVEYIEGSSLDTAGGSLTVNYTDNTKDIIKITPEMCTVDMNKPGKTDVTVTYEGITISYPITIKAKVLSGIELGIAPIAKYLAGDAFDLTGAALSSVYDNGTKGESDIPLTLEMVTGFDSSKIGPQKLTIKYKDFSIKFDVEVLSRETVDGFIADIEKLNVKDLTIDDQAAVSALSDRFMKLSLIEQKAVSTENFQILKDAESRIQNLLEISKKEAAEKEATEKAQILAAQKEAEKKAEAQKVAAQKEAEKKAEAQKATTKQASKTEKTLKESSNVANKAKTADQSSNPHTSIVSERNMTAMMFSGLVLLAGCGVYVCLKKRKQSS